MTTSDRPVVILGGGINGAAAARELALNGVPVWLVDTADLSFGATAYSSRLIHGGLRYLEYGDLALVKESLAERTRLLQLAPRLVKPLRLFIPVKSHWGGMRQAAARFLGRPVRGMHVSRGLRLVQMGLWMYDTYARDKSLPRRSVHRLGATGTPPVNPAAGKWLCAYSDAQVPFPERLALAMLRDAEIAATQRGVELQVLTYHRASLRGTSVEIRPVDRPDTAPVAALEPAAIVNATGSWVDRTLAQLPAPSRRLMGGTKGTHFFTWNAALRDALGGRGVYTEARDGRPVFLLPLAGGTLVGTTDLPFDGDPGAAVATEQELEYLLGVAGDVFPQASLARESIAWHYCGVRPLPFADKTTPAAITRRHQLVWNDGCPVPLVSLVGGKLTTARSLAEETAAAVLKRLGRPAKVTSGDRPLPGGEVPELSDAASVIEREWVTRLEDMVERRLMLLYNPDFNETVLTDLAAALVAAGRLPAIDAPAAIARCRERLKTHFGFELPPDAPPP